MPGGHGTFVDSSCAGGRVARSLRAIRQAARLHTHMRIPLCGIPPLVLWGIYVVWGITLSARMSRERVPGPGPSAFSSKESYTPEGQRLRALFEKWYNLSRAFLVLVLAGLVGGIVCNAVRW